VQVLSTLPQRELCNGMAEVIKAAAIWDASLFDTLERCCGDVLARVPAALLSVIGAAIAIKVAVVSKDERESGVRAILNYGHTVGHALEATMQVCCENAKCVVKRPCARQTSSVHPSVARPSTRRVGPVPPQPPSACSSNAWQYA
jgi:3-dehydroquinate synthetase